MEWLGRMAVKSNCSHMSWTANANNARGLAFYERLEAREVMRGGSSVTLQLNEAPMSVLAGMDGVNRAA